MEINIKKRIAFSEFVATVDAVIKSCFEDEESGVYLPYLREFAIRRAVVAMYSDVELPDASTMEGSDECEQFIAENDLYEKVMSEADTDQVYQLIDAIKDGIDYEIDRRNCELKQELARSAAAMEVLYGQVVELVGALRVFSDGDLSGLADELKRSADIMNGNITEIAELYKKGEATEE